MRGSLTTDKGSGQVEGAEHDTDWKTSLARHA